MSSPDRPAPGSSRLPFEKWQGLGNDFVIVDAHAWESDGRAAAICDRNFGVGADGVLVVGPHPDADARMTVLNSDGSRPQMCGNGLRCVAARLGDGVWSIQTDAGRYICEVAAGVVTVPMGTVRVGDAIELTVDGHCFGLTQANSGNPHAVAVVDTDDIGGLCHRFGRALCSHPAFPEGANIEFARVVDPCRVKLAVWERGAGATLACGTGACAAVATLVQLGMCPSGEEISVDLPGGRLNVWATLDGTTQMRGPAVRVFTGEIDL